MRTQQQQLQTQQQQQQQQLQTQQQQLQTQQSWNHLCLFYYLPAFCSDTATSKNKHKFVHNGCKRAHPFSIFCTFYTIS